MTRRRLPYAVLGAAALAALGAADPAENAPRARWARLETPPVIDGTLDDPAWKRATHIERFRVITDGAAPSENTEAWLGYDDRALYLAFRMTQANVLNPDLPLGPQVNGAVTARDGSFSTEDWVEVLLNPTDDPETRHLYYRFAINTLGAQADAFGQDPRWDAHWEAAVGHGVGFWVVELAIPYSTFARHAGRGAPAWRMNLCRANAGKKEYSAWSPGFQKQFAAPERFAVVEAPAVALERYAQFSVPHLTFHDINPPQSSLQAQVAVQNQTDQPRDALVVVIVTPEAGAAHAVERAVSVPAREAVTLRVPVPLAGGGRMRADVLVRDPKTRELLAYAQPARFSAPEALSLTPTRSYYTREPQAELIVRAALDPALLTGAEFALAVRDAETERWTARAPAQPKARLGVPIADLPAGRHTVEARLVRGDAVLGRVERELVKRPGTRNEVKFNEQMGAVVDGELFFPFGITHVPEPALEEVSELGFNCVLIEQNAIERRAGWDDGAKMKQWRQFMDKAHALGLKAIPGLFHAGTGFKEDFEAFFPNYMAPEGLATLIDHPALLAWYSVGEPNPPERDLVVRLYDSLNALDPYHPVFPIFCINLRFEDGWDIGCVDAYWTTHGGDPTYVAKLTDSARRITTAKRAPFWIVPMAALFSASRRELTPAEQRCQTYLALVHQAQGIIYFRFRPCCEELWQEMGALAREVKPLTPFLLDAETLGEVMVQPLDVPTCAIHTLYRERDGRRVLLALNAENRPVTVRFELPAPAVLAGVSDFFTGAPILLQDGRLEDRFEGYASRVYEIKGP